MSEASGHQGLWTEPKFSGDAVRFLSLTRDGRAGSIQIQHFGEFVKVGSFLPGVVMDGKPWPEKSQTVDNNFLADGIFDDYVQCAYADFWQRDYKEPNG